MRGAGWWRGGGHRDLVRRWARLMQTAWNSLGQQAGGWSGFGGAPSSFLCLGAASPPPHLGDSGAPPPSVHLSTFELGMGRTSLNLLLWPSRGWGQVG